MTAIERSSPRRRSRSAAGSWTLSIAPAGSSSKSRPRSATRATRVLEAHHPGQAGGRVLPQAVADHDGRAGRPATRAAAPWRTRSRTGRAAREAGARAPPARRRRTRAGAGRRRASARTARRSGRTPGGTPARWRRARWPIPAYCAPPPGNMKTSRAVAGRAVAGGALDSSVQLPRRLRQSDATTARRRPLVPATHRQRVRDVRRLELRPALQVLGERACRALERSSVRAEARQLVVARATASSGGGGGACSRTTWAFVPPSAEGADAGPPRRGPARPRRQPVDDAERARTRSRSRGWAR